jgi:hypothetical protein
MRFQLITSQRKALLFIISCILLFGCSFNESEERGYRESQTKATDEAISHSIELQRLNAVCTSIRLPAGFTFVSKGGVDDEKIALAYYYSSTVSFGVAKQTFDHYFSESGCTEIDMSDRYPKHIDFYNDDFRISINFREKGSLSNYGICCEKLTS